MKICFSLPVIFITLLGFCQDGLSQTNFIRFYEDNDGINFLGRTFDWGYTNGIRLDLFHQKENNSSDHSSKLDPSTAGNKIRVTGWSVMQVMITPKKIKPLVPDRNDYSYCGALLISHSLHVSDKQKKLNVQTEWKLGVMGPYSFGEQSQICLHRMMGDPRPNGWGYQLPTDVLFNYEFTAEKQVKGGKFYQLTGGGKTFGGTLSDGFSFYSILRFQYNSGLFSGLPFQYFAINKRKPGIVISVKPAIDLTFYNALLDGGLFNKRSPVRDKASAYATRLERRIITSYLDVMALFSIKNVSMSVSQKIVSPEFKGYSSHQVGNVSLYVGW